MSTDPSNPFRKCRYLAAVLAFTLAITPQIRAATPASKPSDQPPLPRYHVTELRFPDSPDHGAALDVPRPGFPKFDSAVCSPQGLSENDYATGSIVGADSKEHLFIYEHGEIIDLQNHVDCERISSVISPDGVVVAILHARQKAGEKKEIPNRLVMYKEGKLSDITPRVASPFILGAPNSRGDFLVRLAGLPSEPLCLLCSIRSPLQKPIPLAALAGDAVVGMDLQIRNKEKVLVPFALKDGVTFRFPPSDKMGGIPEEYRPPNAASGTNDSGDFAFAMGQRDRAYVANAISHKITEIPLPANPPATMFTELLVDDEGDVFGTLVNNMGLGAPQFPFIFHAGKSVLLSEIIPHLKSVLFCTRSGVLAGTLDNNHLFLRDRKGIVDLGAIDLQPRIAPGFPPFQARVNNFNQVLLWPTVGSTEKPKVLLATGSRLIDLNTYLPPNADYEFTRGDFINDHGVIVVFSNFNLVNGERHLFLRSFVLTPEVPNATQPITSPSATNPGPTTSPTSH